MDFFFKKLQYSFWKYNWNSTSNSPKGMLTIVVWLIFLCKRATERAIDKLSYISNNHLFDRSIVLSIVHRSDSKKAVSANSNYNRDAQYFLVKVIKSPLGEKACRSRRDETPFWGWSGRFRWRWSMVGLMALWHDHHWRLASKWRCWWRRGHVVRSFEASSCLFCFLSSTSHCWTNWTMYVTRF